MPYPFRYPAEAWTAARRWIEPDPEAIRPAATATFPLISAGYEGGRVILSSNKGFAARGEVLGGW